MPSRLDREQFHGRKTGKSTDHASRSTSSKGILSSQIHNHPHSLKHSTISKFKQEDMEMQSTSPTSDRQQQSKTNIVSASSVPIYIGNESRISRIKNFVFS